MKFFFKMQLLLLTLFTSSVAFAADPISTAWHNNLAVKGYDTVAYFTDGKPAKGKKSFQTEWRGAQWRFVSQAHLDLFKQDPEKYAPQYGGYCAFAVANNQLAGIDPTQFSVVEGKLYLNYNAKIQKQWLANRDPFIDQANQNWPTVLK